MLICLVSNTLFLIPNLHIIALLSIFLSPFCLNNSSPKQLTRITLLRLGTFPLFSFYRTNEISLLRKEFPNKIRKGHPRSFFNSTLLSIFLSYVSEWSIPKYDNSPLLTLFKPETLAFLHKIDQTFFRHKISRIKFLLFQKEIFHLFFSNDARIPPTPLAFLYFRIIHLENSKPRVTLLLESEYPSSCKRNFFFLETNVFPTLQLAVYLCVFSPGIIHPRNN